WRPGAPRAALTPAVAPNYPPHSCHVNTAGVLQPSRHPCWPWLPLLQLLGVKESPSTASTTPDSTDGGTESDFPELQTAREFSEDEDTGSLGWATPRELTFSYIAFTPGHDASPPRDARTRRDSGARRPRGGLGAGPGPSPPRPEPPAPALGDSLENIPSLCQSPEGERGQGLGLDPFLAWDAPLRYTNDPEPLELGNSPPTQPQLVPTTKITVEPGAPQVTEAAAGSETALEVTPGDLQLTPALALHPAEGTPCWAEGTLSSSGTLEGPGFQGSWDADDPQEEKALLETEPIPEQCLEELDQSGNRLEAYNMVLELVLWRDMRASGLVLTGLVLVLLCLAHFSAVSVCAWAALGTLGVTLSLRLYHMLLGALRPGHRPNPFQPLLDTDVSLSPEQLEHMAERIGQHMAAGTRTLRHLFLVEDLVDSLKFAFLFYILTYVGAVFNGLTLLLMGVISAFTFPVLYRHHQAQIDQYVGLVRNQLSHLRAKIQAKLPSAKAKAE
ncbi:PREDICTED: reticulon-2-like, partial [Crocodylus porosus]|uniref:reticulon-2-like n=1 Tax=Crocodylus porosus TaxID=8502 RepID=UPI000938D426